MFQEDTFKRFHEKIKLTFRLLQTIDIVIPRRRWWWSVSQSAGRMKENEDADDDEDDEVGKWVIEDRPFQSLIKFLQTNLGTRKVFCGVFGQTDFSSFLQLLLSGNVVFVVGK